MHLQLLVILPQKKQTSHRQQIKEGSAFGSTNHRQISPNGAPFFTLLPGAPKASAPSGLIWKAWFIYEQLLGHKKFNREGEKVEEGKRKYRKEAAHFIPRAPYSPSRLVFLIRTFRIIKYYIDSK
jgi:hypothetical protein